MYHSRLLTTKMDQLITTIIKMVLLCNILSTIPRGSGAPLSPVIEAGEVEGPTGVAVTTEGSPVSTTERPSDGRFTYSAKIGNLRFQMTTTVTVEENDKDAAAETPSVDTKETIRTTKLPTTTTATTTAAAAAAAAALQEGGVVSYLEVFQKMPSIPHNAMPNVEDLEDHPSRKEDQCVATWGNVFAYKVGNIPKSISQVTSCRTNCLKCLLPGHIVGLTYEKINQLVHVPIEQADGSSIYTYTVRPVWLAVGCGCVLP